jgi:hypothetical protein
MFRKPAVRANRRLERSDLPALHMLPFFSLVSKSKFHCGLKQERFYFKKTLNKLILEEEIMKEFCIKHY